MRFQEILLSSFPFFIYGNLFRSLKRIKSYNIKPELMDFFSGGNIIKSC